MKILPFLALLVAFSQVPAKGRTAAPSVQPEVLPRPSFDYTHHADALELISLEILDSEPNAGSDYGEWFMDHYYPAETYHNGGVNEAIRSDYPPDVLSMVLTVGRNDYHLYQIMYGSETKIGSYGSPPNRLGVVLDPRILLSVDYETGDLNWALDFSRYALGPSNTVGQSVVRQSVRWAEEHNGILYVSSWHRTYAESSEGLNGYITALDLDDMSIVWRSEPLVCNSENFVIIGDTIVSGYGFTDEPDYIYLTNRLTGEVYHRIRVSSAPEHLVFEDESLFVRCYDTDYVLEVIP
ncbi:hypothetical protein GF402_07355 [Candidatus Fermentibacteria bacterium]|nr:hypothetical protein [Candidatus Fermentibacteria bacterium]